MEIYYIRTIWYCEFNVTPDYYAVIRKHSSSIPDDIFYFNIKEPVVSYKIERTKNSRPLIIKSPAYNKISDIDYFCRRIKIENKRVYKNISVTSNINEKNYLKYLWKKFVLSRKLRKIVYAITCNDI